jgi:hypothetical protein
VFGVSEAQNLSIDFSAVLINQPFEGPATLCRLEPFAGKPRRDLFYLSRRHDRQHPEEAKIGLSHPKPAAIHRHLTARPPLIPRPVARQHRLAA